MLKRALLLAVLVILPVTAALADEITLKDGRVLEGKIIREDELSVTLKLKLGEMTFNRDQIESIEYGPVEEPEQPEDEPESKPRPAIKNEREILSLIRRYVEEDNEESRAHLAEALQPALEADPEIVERAAGNFRKFTTLRTGHTEGSLEVNGVKTEYALFIPSKYDRKKAWPLIVSLHGASGNGPAYIRLWHVPVKGRLDKEQKIKYQQAEVRGYIVVSPTAKADWKWGPAKEADDHILSLIEHVRDTYHVDPDRIYVHGLSMGGFGAWRFGLHFADRFAAIEPRAGSYDFRFLDNAKNLSVYITHGAKDESVSVKHSRDAASKLKELGYDHHYSEIPEGGHQFFIDENPRVLDFFDKRRRNPYPREVVWLADLPAHGRAYWLEIAQFKSPGLARIEGGYDSEANLIEIRTDNVSKLTVYLSRRMVDFTKPVVVKVNGEEKHNALVKPSAATLLEILRTTRDETRLFSAKLEFELK
jgi:predicted esterase